MSKGSYKNYSTEYILNKLRDIRYANVEMVYGFFNQISVEYKLMINVVALSLQADLFAREMLSNRSKFDFKRFLGPFTEDWPRILHEAFIFDRLKCIYYGVNFTSMLKLPTNSYSFPGNIVLMHLLAKASFKYETDDAQPFSLYVNISCNTNLVELFEPVFQAYPNLRQGMSDINNVKSYQNTQCDSVLKGLYNGMKYLESNGNRKNGGAFFEMHAMNDETMRTFVNAESNPLTNSFIIDNEHSDKWYFILPYDKSGPGVMRNNESLFASRAMGFTSSQITTLGNDFYTVASRQPERDPFTRDDLYAITIMQTEFVPYSQDEIKKYLSINTYKKLEDEANGYTSGGDNSKGTP